MPPTLPADDLRRENERLRAQNARLRAALEEARAQVEEPEAILRAIREGEVDALVVHEAGRERIYSLQTYDSVYRAVVEECFPYGVWLAKPDGELLYVTPSFLQTLGMTLDELRERGQFHFLPPGPRAELDARWAECRATGRPFSAEYRIVRPDGAGRTVWTQGMLVPTPDGRAHWVGVNIDMTERRRDRDALQRQAAALEEKNQDLRERMDRHREIESALLETNERHRAVTDNATTAIFMMDPAGRCTFMNPAAEAMTGFRFDEARGRVLHDLIHHRRPDGSYYPLAECPIDRALPEYFEVRDHQDVFLRKDGSFFPVLCNARPIRHDGAPVGTVIEVRDITREQEAERQIRRLVDDLREQDHRKDEFLAMLAHELRNPLAPIRNAVSVLAMAEDDPETRRWSRAVIDRQLRHLTSLVDDLLDVSRINEGKITLARQPLAVSAFVQAAVEASRPLIDARRHHLDVALPPEPLWVDGDPTRLAQVVLNLLNNAAKYTPAGGDIRLAVERRGAEAVALRVRDNGKGIPPEMCAKVFDLFTQVDTSLDRAEGGLGIGLTLVDRLVRLHGGTVEVHSEGPGRGCEFTVTLPRMAHAPAAAPAAPAVDASPGRRRVLLVDDSRDAAETLARLLRRLGHEVAVAHDGPAALDAAAAFAPDLALLDIGLPGMDGYELARRLRADPARGGLQLVAVTGYGSAADRRRARDAGFDEHLVKPVALDDLRRVLDRPRATAG
jgi:PAS domain S-box-containing protein